MIHLVSINTWKCDGDYNKRLTVLVKQLKQLNPTLIAVQEGFQTLNLKYDTTRAIAGELDFHFVSSQSRKKLRKVEGEEMESYSSVSIISKYPILQHHIIALPSNVEDGGRDVIAAEIKIDNKIIVLINVHLTHLRNASELRKHQLEFLLEQSFVHQNADAVFICGDFNSQVNSESLVSFFKQPYNMIDTFNFRKNRNGLEYTRSSESSFARIDHILLLPIQQKKTPEIFDSKIVLHETDLIMGVKASDHNGIMTSFNF